MASKNFTVRIDEELEDAIRDSANAMGLSVSDYVRLAMTNQNQRKATAILMPCIDVSDRNTTQDESIDTLRQELAELRNAIALQRNTALQTELTELRAAIEQGKCETVEMLNVLRIDIWGDDHDCDFDDERNLVVGGTVTDTSQNLILVACDVRDLREELNWLPAELARQDKRIDRWVEQVKMRDTQTLKHKAEVEAIAEVYGELVKGIEHNCDRIEVLEKVNKISRKTGSGMGFGK